MRRPAARYEPNRLETGPCDMGRVDIGHQENVPGLNLGGLNPLHLNDVEAERRLHRVGDDSGLQSKRHPLKLGNHHPPAEPVQGASLLLGAWVLREAPGRGRKVGPTAKLQDDGIGVGLGAGLRGR